MVRGRPARQSPVTALASSVRGAPDPKVILSADCSRAAANDMGFGTFRRGGDGPFHVVRCTNRVLRTGWRPDRGCGCPGRSRSDCGRCERRLRPPGRYGRRLRHLDRYRRQPYLIALTCGYRCGGCVDATPADIMWVPEAVAEGSGSCRRSPGRKYPCRQPTQRFPALRAHPYTTNAPHSVRGVLVSSDPYDGDAVRDLRAHAAAATPGPSMHVRQP